MRYESKQAIRERGIYLIYVSKTEASKVSGQLLNINHKYSTDHGRARGRLGPRTRYYQIPGDFKGGRKYRVADSRIELLRLGEFRCKDSIVDNNHFSEQQVTILILI